LEPTTFSLLLPTLAYLVHQLGQIYIIWQVKGAKQRGEVDWDPAFAAATLNTEHEPADGAQVSKPPPAEMDYRPNIYAQRMFSLNIGMILFKFTQSFFTYDGLANDVPEWTAQYSVMWWIFLALIIQMPKRGLLFGYIRSFDNPCGFGKDFVNFVRKQHGYAFSFGVTYNYWFHPIEGSPGFVLGYLYQFLMMLQSNFLLHPFHRNKFWTLILQVGIVPHAFFIAWYFANGSAGSVFQFPFGFAMLFITTFMHGFELSFWQKAGFTVAFFVVAVSTYLAVGRDLSNIGEIFRISVFVLSPVLGWVLWGIGLILLWPFKQMNERHPWTTGALWFGLHALQIGAFYYWGATGGRGVDR